MITVIDSQNGKVKNSPDIISRGFIYLKESHDLLKQTRFLIRKVVEEATGKMHPINADYVKESLKERWQSSYSKKLIADRWSCR